MKQMRVNIEHIEENTHRMLEVIDQEKRRIAESDAPEDAKRLQAVTLFTLECFIRGLRQRVEKVKQGELTLEEVETELQGVLDSVDASWRHKISMN